MTIQQWQAHLTWSQAALLWCLLILAGTAASFVLRAAWLERRFEFLVTALCVLVFTGIVGTMIVLII